MDSLFLHKGCEGKISIDIMKAFTWKSPSIVLAPEGVKIGVTEFRGGTSKKGDMIFTCEECGEVISSKQFAEELVMECMICGETHSIEEMGTCRQLQCVCENCRNILSGKVLPKNSKERDTVKFLFLGSMSEIQFIPVSKILEKSVIFE